MRIQALILAVASLLSTAANAGTGLTKQQFQACRSLGVDGTATTSLGAATKSENCKTKEINGLPVPDSACTPGAVNPSVTADVLSSTKPKFTTKCVRDHITSETTKNQTYDWYGIPKPKNNQGATQVCELDHLVSLELGGADSLDNLWPQCGPNKTTLNNRFFKQKDAVENYLNWMVVGGCMTLQDAQKGIASDWTQYLADAKKKRKKGAKCNA